MTDHYTDQELYDLFSTVVSDQSKIPYVKNPVEVRCQNIDELKAYADLCQQMIIEVNQIISVVVPNLTLEIGKEQYQVLLNTCNKTIAEKPFNLLLGDTLIVYFKNSIKKSFELQGLDLSLEKINKSLDYAKSMWEAQKHLLSVCSSEQECCLDFITRMSAENREHNPKINEKIQMKYLKIRQSAQSVSKYPSPVMKVYQDFLKWEKEEQKK